MNYTSYKTFTLRVISPLGSVFENSNVTAVSIKTIDGDTTLLAGHESYVSVLRQGDIIINKKDGGIKGLNLSGGFVEFFDNVMTVLGAEIRQ